MIEERIKQFTAFRFTKADDVPSQVGTDVQRFTSGVRVGADNGMVDQLRRILAFDMMTMDSAQSLEQDFEARIKPLIGGVAVAPPRSTAGGRQLNGVDDGERSRAPQI